MSRVELRTIAELRVVSSSITADTQLCANVSRKSVWDGYEVAVDLCARAGACLETRPFFGSGTGFWPHAANMAPQFPIEGFCRE